MQKILSIIGEVVVRRKKGCYKVDRSQMEDKIRLFFTNYEKKFNESLAGKTDLETITKFYAEEFIAANPNGVKAGKNDEQLKVAMSKGYEYYRFIGTRKMKCQNVDLMLLDDKHAVARTKWVAFYLKQAEEISIPFEANYLMQFRQGQPLIFCWVTGDESQLLKERGII